ncbi:MAG: GTP cyclohydrolase I FolE2 [Niabella sp.]|nr:MAG: GTP cyclohydrolase I FolE2 [Niabella sp.]
MNHFTNFSVMPDVQASSDSREIAIQRVGVKNVRHPIILETLSGTQASIAHYDLDVLLEADKKGTHMSRFIELLEAQKTPLSLRSFRQMLTAMLDKLNAQAGRIVLSCPYFIKKTAPVSGVQSLLDYQISFSGEVKQHEGQTDCALWLKVEVPVTSLCPCSKEISRYGAHNQRSFIIIQAELIDDVAIEELIRIAEEESSCELWGLLKRSDEKYVTERAYENPKFVEDLVRGVAVRLDADKRIRHYVVEAENFESIHNHSAYALIDSRAR